MNELTLESLAFEHNGAIPSKYTCDGENINPDVSWHGIPEGAVSLAFIMDDPDIPESVQQSMGISVFDHWIVFDIAAGSTGIMEGIEPDGQAGLNSAGSTGYTGPCPPDREHKYFFKLYALDTELGLPEGATKAEVEAAMEGHILATGILIGRYERQ